MKQQIINWLNKWLWPTIALGGIFGFGVITGITIDFFYHGPNVYCGTPHIDTVKDGWNITLRCFKS